MNNREELYKEVASMRIALIDLEEKIDDLEEEQKPEIGFDGLPVDGGAMVFVVSYDGEITKRRKLFIELYWIEQGRVFATREEAELFSKREKLTHRFKCKVREYNGDLVADFSDEFERKSRFIFSHVMSLMIVTFDMGQQNADIAMYFHEKSEQKLRADFTESELKLIHIGVE